MSKRPWLSFGFIVPMLAALLLMIAVSCGDDDATAVPRAATSAEVAAAQAAAAQAAEAAETAAAQAAAAAAQAAELAAAVEAAQAAAGGEETAAVKAALAAAAQASAAAQAAAAKAAELAIAVPTPAPEAAMAAKVEPTGELNLGFKEIGPYQGNTALTGHPQWGYIGLAAYESLFSRDVNGVVFGKLAEDDWTVSDDNLTWTFKLRRGAQFHGGWGEVTAEDVVWSMTHSTREGTLSLSNSEIKRLFFNPLGGHFEALDPYTIELNTGVPAWGVLQYLFFPSTNAIWVISKKQTQELAESIGEDAANGQLAGTGPYEMVEHRTGEFWKFKGVNPHYRKVPEFAEMSFQEIPEESTRIANFQTGRIDVFSAAPDTLAPLAAIADTKFMSQGGASESSVRFYGAYYDSYDVGNCPEGAYACPAEGWDPGAPYVSSNPDPDSPEWEVARKVREAMGIAIDRDLIIEELFGGEGEPLSMWSWGVHGNLADPSWVWEYDIERAKQLLKEAGHEDGFDVTITPAIRGAPAEVEACEAVADMWADIGITATIKNIPFGTLVGGQVTRSGLGSKDLTCHAANPEFEPLLAMQYMWDPKIGYSAGSDHPYLTPRLYEAVATFDREERHRKTKEMGQWVWDNSFDLGLYMVNTTYALGPKVDSWAEHLETNDPRRISGLEWAIHRK